jgi:hypothetical protein
MPPPTHLNVNPPALQLLEDHRGEDISELFAGASSEGHAHSRGARALLENYRVGQLEGQEAGEGRADLSGLVDESKALLPQVGGCVVPGGCCLLGAARQPVARGLLLGPSGPFWYRLWPVAAQAGGAIVFCCCCRLNPLPPCPLLQVSKLDPATYLEWIAAPSTGHPVMFPNPLVERLTCTQW